MFTKGIVISFRVILFDHEIQNYAHVMMTIYLLLLQGTRMPNMNFIHSQRTKDPIAVTSATSAYLKVNCNVLTS